MKLDTKRSAFIAIDLQQAFCTINGSVARQGRDITPCRDAALRCVELADAARANGIPGVPVMKDGDLAGIVTRRDLRFETDTSQSISAIMTPREQLVTVKEGASSDEVQRLLHQHRIEKILVVDDAGALAGLITVKDFDKPSPSQTRVRMNTGSCGLVRRLEQVPIRTSVLMLWSMQASMYWSSIQHTVTR